MHTVRTAAIARAKGMIFDVFLAVSSKKVLDDFVLLEGSFLIAMTFIYPLVLGNVEITDLSFLFTGYLGLFLNFS